MGESMRVRLTLAYAHARAGDGARAREMLDQALAQRGQRHVPSHMVASVLGALGELEPAWQWLERAVGERDHWLAFLTVGPFFDAFRADARFAELRRKVGL